MDKKKLVLLIMLVIIIPGIIGTTYMLGGKEMASSMLHSARRGGYVYRNIWSNFLLFIPFIIYKLYISVKENKLYMEDIAFYSILLYISSTLVLRSLNMLSKYYFYKIYYALWIIAICLAIEGMILFIKNYKKQIYSICFYIAFYIIVFFICIFKYDVPQSWVPQDTLANVMEIFSHNRTMLQYTEPIVTKEEYDLFLKFEEIIDNKWQDIDVNDALFITGKVSNYWLNSLTGYKSYMFQFYKEKDDFKRTVELTCLQLDKTDFEYIILNKNSREYQECKKSINFESYDIVYSNSLGEILQRK